MALGLFKCLKIVVLHSKGVRSNPMAVSSVVGAGALTYCLSSLSCSLIEVSAKKVGWDMLVQNSGVVQTADSLAQ